MPQRSGKRRYAFAMGGVVVLALTAGCGAGDTNPLPAGQTSPFTGKYTGSYTGPNGQRGTLLANIATSGVIDGTLTNTLLSPLSGPLTGMVGQDGSFTLSYYYNFHPETVYSGTGTITKSGPNINGTWNITSPTTAATTLTFTLTPAPATTQ